jgi:uncharacterized protein YdeI (YjbR/CyaY-like superfamily)
MTERAPAGDVHVETRELWRAWLAAHHESAASVWLVSWRKHTGKPAMTYEESVCEALAFGWVDSKGGKLDDDRTKLYFTPRRPRSGWSRPNKLRIEALEREGLMTEAGRRLVRAAQDDGSWTALDDVENLMVPADLAAALGAYVDARRHWDAFPRSVRRAVLEWIGQARRPATREKRVAETAALAAENKRANQWRPPAER